MLLPRISEKIIRLKEDDLKMRNKLIQLGQLSVGYHPDMRAVHEANVEVLEQIIDDIGYPTIDLVGIEASDAAWLIIQHAIGNPRFMKKCALMLEKAANQGTADPVNLAYLTDRIAVYQGEPQLFGTQYDWDEDGNQSLQEIDDHSKVNQRRKTIGLNTIEAQTALIRERVQQENQTPPTDYAAYKNAQMDWLKSVGWIS